MLLLVYYYCKMHYWTLPSASCNKMLWNYKWILLARWMSLWFGVFGVNIIDGFMVKMNAVTRVWVLIWEGWHSSEKVNFGGILCKLSSKLFSHLWNNSGFGVGFVFSSLFAAFSSSRSNICYEVNLFLPLLLPPSPYKTPLSHGAMFTGWCCLQEAPLLSSCLLFCVCPIKTHAKFSQLRSQVITLKCTVPSNTFFPP